MCKYVKNDLAPEMAHSNFTDVADAELGSVCDHIIFMWI